ncbi:hypothetical protein EW026_g1338 [Hermanssonia centrifuga]|uniref:Uncharacterized protein n=1 Tax=Hermanssonia centrifuga TaxID=98765 RepID=A0A4V3XBC3_9APHY|nr:hypothetical protein EW026_g1338 [Hermanssonia centrifuga]
MAEDIDADAVPTVNLALQASVSVDESWMSDSADADAAALASVRP